MQTSWLLAESLWRTNLLSPPILFFFLGMIAVFLRSGLEIPAAFTKVLSLYLLWSIGFKGGVQLQHTGLGPDVALPALCAMALSALIPMYVFPLLRWKLGAPTAAAAAATYGSVSVVTFLAATTLLDENNVPHGGHMVAITALMESPAVMIGVLMSRWFGDASTKHQPKLGMGSLLHDALLNSAVVLLVGSLLVGYFSEGKTQAKVIPLSNDLFYGLLCFFLLDLGLLAGKNAFDLFRAGWFVVLAAIVIPLINSVIAGFTAKMLNMSFGDGFLFMVLAASGSYIAVPAAMKLAIPAAKQEIFVPMALTLTFPFNVTLGLPIYWWMAEHLLKVPQS